MDSEVVERALKDAEALIRSQGPSSATDRLHTAIHGYLLAACNDAGIACRRDDSVMTLFKSLRAEHQALKDLGPRSQDITRVLQALATILDALNPVRNYASAAHPNPTLLGEAEAVLVINTVRTFLHYLDTKLR